MFFLCGMLFFSKKTITTLVKLTNFGKKKNYHVIYQSFEEYECNTHT
jgi:hypothetical protein